MIYQVSVVATVGFVSSRSAPACPFGAVVAFVPVVAMAQVVPISLSGLGVREGMFVLLLTRSASRTASRSASACSGTSRCCS